jgi:hypothetical protein
MSGSSLASGAEGSAMETVGLAVWRQMAEIVDSNPFYAGVEEPERSACIARLATQALLCAAVECAPKQQTVYVLLTGVGRLIGQLVAQAPDVEGENAVMEFLAKEIAIGARDFREVSTPRGCA